MEKVLKDTLEGGKFKDVPPSHSKRMSAIKGKGNKTTETKLRFALVGAGIKGWKLHPRGMVGNPDFFFPQNRLAVFVDGCFWHGCDKCGHVPKKNNTYWSAKLRRNKERDAQKTILLTESGVRVLRLWEHEIQADVRKCAERIKVALSVTT